MNAKQKKFAEEYLIDLNGTQAAIRAGYSPKTANVHGARLLTNVNVRAYIDRELERLHSERTADIQEIMEYLTAVMRGEKTEQVLKLSGDGVQTVEEITVSAKERIKAAELLGKRYGMFTDKFDIMGAIPVVISGGEMLDDEMPVPD